MAIVIADYDPAWTSAYTAESAAVRGIMGTHALTVEHMGSTSVPGLAAKPIVDIAVSVPSVPASEREVAGKLGEYGYVFFDAGMSGRLFYYREVNRVRSFHLHLIPEERWELLHERVFRDWLLTHPADRDRYAQVKRELAARVSNGDEYTRAKTDFIQEVVDRARAERGLPSVCVWEE